MNYEFASWGGVTFEIPDGQRIGQIFTATASSTVGSDYGFTQIRGKIRASAWGRSNRSAGISDFPISKGDAVVLKWRGTYWQPVSRWQHGPNVTETVFHGVVEEGAAVGTGWQSIPFTPIYDPFSRWNVSAKRWDAFGFDVYRVNIHCVNNPFGGAAFPFFRPNSATAGVPFIRPGETGGAFGFSWSGIVDRNRPDSGGLDYPQLLLRNDSGAPIRLNGLPFNRGYWSMTVERLYRGDTTP